MTDYAQLARELRKTVLMHFTNTNYTSYNYRYGTRCKTWISEVTLRMVW